MDFILMLTRADRTVSDCLRALDEVAGLGIRHIGFKDVGADLPTLRQLAARINDLGAVSHLEVVSESRDDALASARAAVDLGVDRLMGGTWIEETLALLEGTGIEYLPFAGRPFGHPTRLAGTPEQIAADCRRAAAAGCAGVDLLAHRATDADPLELVRAARAATTGRLVVAGSITTPAQITALGAAGADAFTIGSALFAGAVDPTAATLKSQLAPVLAVLEEAGTGRQSAANATSG
ncbi:hypothetical protein AB0J38_24115 [Streptomyces sp. NPDC050095]|uniref:hypothetical protein n=1 Tax=unclassified Streptomyces TaxID=2593676 RepID=UPI0034149DEB